VADVADLAHVSYFADVCAAGYHRKRRRCVSSSARSSKIMRRGRHAFCQRCASVSATEAMLPEGSLASFHPFIPAAMDQYLNRVSRFNNASNASIPFHLLIARVLYLSRTSLMSRDVPVSGTCANSA
jgi:hypothetical protein